MFDQAGTVPSSYNVGKWWLTSLLAFGLGLIAPTGEDFSYEAQSSHNS